MKSQVEDGDNSVHPSIMKKQASFKKRLLSLLLFVVFAPSLLALIIPAIKSINSSRADNVCYIAEQSYINLVAFDGIQKTVTMFLPFLAWQTISLVAIFLVFLLLLIRELFVYFNKSKIKHPYSFVRNNKLLVFNFFVTMFMINMGSTAYLQAEKAKLAQSTIALQERVQGDEGFYKQCLDASAITISDKNKILSSQEALQDSKQESNNSDVPTPTDK